MFVQGATTNRYNQETVYWGVKSNPGPSCDVRGKWNAPLQEDMDVLVLLQSQDYNVRPEPVVLDIECEVIQSQLLRVVGLRKRPEEE